MIMRPRKALVQGPGGVVVPPNVYSTHLDSGELWIRANALTQVGLRPTTKATFGGWKFHDVINNAVMSYFARWGTSAATQCYLFHKYFSGGTHYLRMVYYDTVSGFTDIRQAIAAPTIGVWIQYTCSVDLTLATASQCEFYADGAPLGNGAVSSDGGVTQFRDAAQDYWMGAATNLTTNLMAGNFDESFVFPSVLSAAEIADMYDRKLNAAEKSAAGGYWEWENDATDSGDEGNELTAHNATSFEAEVPFV